jgi:hypothetical protein
MGQLWSRALMNIERFDERALIHERALMNIKKV